MKVVISSGHGKYVRGASGYLDEVNEARKVVELVADYLEQTDIGIKTYHDDVSRSQNENLHRIVDFHNAQTRDLDISVHFNANKTTSNPVGTECWYITQKELSAQTALAIATAGHLKNRGPKYTSSLYFLNHTEKPAILIEVCFVDSKADSDLYWEHFDAICRGIARTIMEHAGISRPERPPGPERPEGFWHEDITATVFGNPGDEQEGAYGGWIDSDTVGVSFPYKWRDKPRPTVEVQGPAGHTTCGVVDVGPWNTDDPDYVLGTARPLAELQYAEGIEAQNGRVPTNDAGIDLTVPVAERVGVEGKGKVRWRIVE